MDTAQMAMRTWNWHGGREATTKGMRQNLDIGYDNKTHIRNTLLNGQDTRVFDIGNSEELNYITIYNNIRDYAQRQLIKCEKPSRFWYFIYLHTPDSCLFNVLSNTKTTTVQGVHWLSQLLQDVLELDSSHRLDLTKIIFNMSFPSPKLTKQILLIAKQNNLDLERIDEILSGFSVVQSFKPKDSVDKKIVLSINPIDFITGSLNDYNWTSCTAPSGAYAVTPIALYMDAFTIIAYIPSEKSEYILFKEGDKHYTGSNKQMRRYIHFNSDYTGLIMNQTYPHQNPAFDSALIKIFEDLGFKLETEDNLKKNIINQVDIDSYFVYDDLTTTDNRVLVMGEHQAYTVLDGEPTCLHCGDDLSGYGYYEDDEEELHKGLCESCTRNLGYYEGEEEDW